MHCVIGSGPAGVAAAAALLRRGIPVTMLDAGGALEPDRAALAARLGAQHPDAWDAADRATLAGPLRYNSEGTPLKLAFGSDFVYRDGDALQPVSALGVDAYRALATGGLSVLWGAAVLPYSDADLSDWPLSGAELAPYYRSALALTGLSAQRDDLASLYPLYTEPTTPLGLSAQARAIQARMEAHRHELGTSRVHFGQARLAITQPPGANTGCTHCGMCLYGCPYGLIYSSRMTLEGELATSPDFTYRPGVLVRRLREQHGGVTIEGVVRATGSPQRFEAERVYLAAGTLASTTILLDSLEAVDQTIVMGQSDHFLLPLLLPGPQGRPSRERLHTLSQLFIEVLDPQVSRRGVHLQVYTYNDFYTRMAKDRLGPLFPLAAPLFDRLIGRVSAIKGYLHSGESAGISATLRQDTSAGRLELRPVPQRATDGIIKRTIDLMQRHRHAFGMSPLRMGLRKGPPGSGVHVGASFPMRRQPGMFESDVMGRPTGLTRVHIVDASVFPTLPAAPPTLTVMANAFRIAAAAGIHEDPTCSG